MAKNAYIVITTDDDSRLMSGYTNRQKANYHIEELILNYALDGYVTVRDEISRLYGILRTVEMRKGKKKAIKFTLQKLELK